MIPNKYTLGSRIPRYRKEKQSTKRNRLIHVVLGDIIRHRDKISTKMEDLHNSNNVNYLIFKSHSTQCQNSADSLPGHMKQLTKTQFSKP